MVIKDIIFVADTVHYGDCHGGGVAPAAHRHVLPGGDSQRLPLSAAAGDGRGRPARHGGAERGGEAGAALQGLSLLRQAATRGVTCGWETSSIKCPQADLILLSRFDLRHILRKLTIY